MLRLIADLGIDADKGHAADSLQPAAYLTATTLRTDAETVVRLAKSSAHDEPFKIFSSITDAPDFSARDAPMRVMFYDWMEGTLNFPDLFRDCGIPPCNLGRVAQTGTWFDFKEGIVTRRVLADIMWSIRAPGNQIVCFEYCPPHDSKPGVLSPWAVVAAGTKPAGAWAHLALSPLPTGCYYLIPDSPDSFSAVRHGTKNDLAWYTMNV